MHQMAPSLRNKALVVTALSLIAWLLWSETRTIHHPWADLSRGAYTDHFSHMNAARVFPRVGLDLWRRGPRTYLPELQGEALARMPADIRAGGSYSGGVYLLPGLPADKPWVTSWAHNPRLYPPGDLVLVAPIAALYEWTDLSLAQANRLLIALFLVFTHIGLFFALQLALREGGLSTPLLWICLLLVYSESVHWALEGFYDFSVATPLLLCVGYLRRRRALAAAVAYCAAAFIHFRALFFAPYAIYAAWMFLQDAQWRGFTRRHWLAVLAMLPLTAGVFVVFGILSPVLTKLPVNNPVNVLVQPLTATLIVVFGLIVMAAAGLIVRARAWLDLAMLVWMAGMLATLREAYYWHINILLIWLVMPVVRARRGGDESVRGARLLVLTYAGTTVFRNLLWPVWVELLWRA